jgi:hypothetical protein
MDEKGFVFTGDAVLALIIFFIFTASILTYYTMPAYMGSDHEQMEATASDALDVMQSDGTIIAAVAKASQNNTTQAQALLRAELDVLIPNNTAYRMTVGNVTVESNRSVLTSRDVATRVIIVSGPNQGWEGRAWFKIEEVLFQNVPINTTSTVWNFHNWLTNFNPWSSGLQAQPYWGYGTRAKNISFSLPDDAQNIQGKFLLGSSNDHNHLAYGADVVVNNVNNIIAPVNFTYLNTRPGGTTERMYNYQGNVTNLVPGSNNNYYVNFRNMTTGEVYNMPWFSFLASYTTNISIPVGILTQTFDMPDGAGMAVQTAQDLDGSGVANQYGRIYDLSSGSVTSFTNQRVTTWANYWGKNNTYGDDHIPFVITGTPAGIGSAVATTTDVPIPSGSIVFDAYTVINAYGGVDDALVEVWNGAQWKTVFCSFNLNGTTYSSLADGYGNTPGIISLNNSLRAGVTNKVRVTVWDQVPGNDYDFVGLVDGRTTVSYSSFPIRWQNFEFNSYQNSTNISAPIKTFTIGDDARKVILFFGVGLDTRQVKVEVKTTANSTWKTLYNDDTVPFALDIGDLDLNGTRVFTVNGTQGTGNYTTRPGTYNIRVTVTAGQNWQSGDNSGGGNNASANAEIYSGTRVAVIYPKFLANAWASSFADDPLEAQQKANASLIAELQASGINVTDDIRRSIKLEALYTGDLPNSIPVRLELWRS